MKKYDKASPVQLPAPVGGVVAGNFYLIGGLFGMAMATVAAGILFALDREGVHTVPVAAQAGTQCAVGDPIYFKTGTGFTCTSGAGAYLVGYALGIIDAGDTDEIDVAISPMSLTTSAEAIEDAGGADA